MNRFEETRTRSLQEFKNKRFERAALFHGLSEEKKKCISCESRIVWLLPINDLDYVREVVVNTRRRKGQPPYYRGFIIVGYSELSENAKSTRPAYEFFRRVFWLRDNDRKAPNDDGGYQKGAPGEAIDPRTVSPGVMGKLTERAWGKPLSSEEIE